MESSVKYLVLAMFVQVLVPMITLLLMFRRKTKAVKEKRIRARYFKLNNGDASSVPDEITVISNHYNNQFEMPLLFLIGATLAIALKLVDTTFTTMAWLFLITRLIHSVVHLGRNYLPHRYIVFGLSCVILLGMWGLVVGKIFSL